MASQATLEPPATSHRRLAIPKGRTLLQWSCALFFCLLGMRGIASRNLYSDAPNHVMNGALIADWIRSGNLAHPVDFAVDYYARLPAITIPFHPPAFPAIEAIFFLLFGANVVVARALVAFMVAIGVILLFRLAANTTGSPIAAICATAVFFSMNPSTYLASNVMLEMPALVFVLASLYQLRDMDKAFPLGRALAYAFLASLALWTKQQAVFLGLAPFVCIALSRRWRLLLKKEIWIASIIFGMAALGLMALTGAFSGAGGAREIPPHSEISSTLLPRVLYYFKAIAKIFGSIGSIWLLIGCIYAVWQPNTKRRNFGLDLHMAWACSAFAVLFLTGHIDPRYLFFLYPPVLVLAFYTLEFAIGRILPPKWVWCAPALIAAWWVSAIPWQTSKLNPSGPAEAADAIIDGSPHRILYCGNFGAGNFIFSVRGLDPKLETTVIRTDSLGNEFSVAQINELGRRYAIDTLVAPQISIPQPCDALRSGVPSTMLLKAEIPMALPERPSIGKVRIYRFINPTRDPEKGLRIRIQKLRKDIEISPSE